MTTRRTVRKRKPTTRKKAKTKKGIRTADKHAGLFVLEDMQELKNALNDMNKVLSKVTKSTIRFRKSAWYKSAMKQIC